jgi:hypothetical protein
LEVLRTIGIDDAVEECESHENEEDYSYMIDNETPGEDKNIPRDVPPGLTNKKRNSNVSASRTLDMHPGTLVQQNKIRNTFNDVVSGKKSIASSSYFSSQVIDSDDSIKSSKKDKKNNDISKPVIKITEIKSQTKSQFLKSSSNSKSISSSSSDNESKSHNIWEESSKSSSSSKISEEIKEETNTVAP